MAKPFQYEMDLAFFVVSFGYSKADYEQLTETEKAFIRKEYERKTITDTTYTRDAVFNAVSNALQKKGSKFIQLFNKKQVKADKDYNLNAVFIVNEIENRDGKNWVYEVYGANNLPIPQKGGN